MSGLRGLVPATVAIGLGIFTGYYTFHPAIQQLNTERRTMNPSVTPVTYNDSNKKTSIPTASQSSVPSEKSEAPAKAAER